MTVATRSLKLGLLWQGLDASEASEAYRRRFGRLPSVFVAHPGSEVTGVAVIVTWDKTMTPGHIWMPVDGAVLEGLP